MIFMHFLGSETAEAGILRAEVYGLRLGGLGRLIFIDFLGSELWEAGDAKVHFNSFRVPFGTFRWPHYNLYVLWLGRLGRFGIHGFSRFGGLGGWGC